MSTVSFLNLCMILVGLRRHTVWGANTITCHAGEYVLGKPASVSCNLHEDMKERKLNLNIDWYRPNAPTSEPGKEIVYCRSEKAANKHKCRVEDGYRFNDDNGKQPILEILSLDNSSAGFYMCYVIPPDGITSHACTLTAIDGPFETPSKSTVPIAVPVAGAVALLIIIIVGIVYFVQRRRNKRRTKQQEKAANQASEQPLTAPNKITC